MRIDGVSTSTITHVPQGQNQETTINPEKQINQLQSDSGDRKRITEEELIRTIEAANEDIQIYNRRLQFSIHEKTKEIMVKVIDVETEEVIREIPPEKILDMIAKLWELAGIIVDEKV